DNGTHPELRPRRRSDTGRKCRRETVRLYRETAFPAYCRSPELPLTLLSPRALLVSRRRFHQPALAHHLVLNPQQTFGKRLGAGRTAGNVNVHRDDLIDALAHGVGDLEEAAAVR